MSKNLQGFLLIIFFYFFLLLAGTLFWMLNIPTLSFVFPLAAVAAAVATALCIPGRKINNLLVKKSLVNLVVLSSVISIAVLLSVLIFDNSYDGQTYHYETQQAIKNGWNPVKDSLANGTSNIFFINHYAKGYESSAGFFWSFFRHPESGKALNILLLVACFLYVANLLRSLAPKGNKSGQFVLALLIAGNPVSIYQLFTFYVDGQIACLVTILIAALYRAMKNSSSVHLPAAVMVFCILGSIKFTGFIYSLLIFGFFGIWLLVKKRPVWRFTLAGFMAFIITFCMTGYNPYVINTIQQSNPLYPLVGKHKIDIITPVQPASFAHKNSLQKFAESNFSASHNIHGHTVTPEPIIKIPFTFSFNEWLVFKGSECRIAGYGPLFGGVLLLGLVLIIAAVFLKPAEIVRQDAFIVTLLVLLTLLINPEMWMSRYVPQLWLFPFCITWLFRSASFPVIVNKISTAVLVVLGLNITGIAAVNWGVAALISYKMHKELAWLKTLDKPVAVVTNDFIAATERMKLYGIKINEAMPETSPAPMTENIYKLQNSQAIILLPPDVAKFTNTGILKLLDKKLE